MLTNNWTVLPKTFPSRSSLSPGSHSAFKKANEHIIVFEQQGGAGLQACG